MIVGIPIGTVRNGQSLAMPLASIGSIFLRSPSSESEPLTREEEQAPDGTDAWLRETAPGIADEQVLAQFGVTMGQFPVLRWCGYDRVHETGVRRHPRPRPDDCHAPGPSSAVIRYYMITPGDEFL